ncbi:hypothetical protein [Agromyces aerolatus]|uniref:hypothetical protein n=1 Tax=Agromyces sp. LY-1074 TaxID=3074080 RepID=UPI0028568660|nr:MULTISPECIES: hypothetical protein [unclassified Agromyces]MDR5700707.1 hypothetical protein [Agromyces sp. LY-1074]MDR5707228.1 hypothetical protein [Agromyces sp. LY-1358]
MTSQDRPLTRRELRERERLLEQQAASASPQTDAPAPAFPVAPPPQSAPAFPPAPPAAPAAGEPASEPAPAFAPRAVGTTAAEGSPFGGPVAAPVADEAEGSAPADDSPFAPRANPLPWSGRSDLDDDDEPTPERTLTRRELRALIESSQSDDDDPDDGELETPGPIRGAVPVRTATPHEPAANTAGDEPALTTKPVGHWTSQLDLPEAQPEPFDQLLARGVGGSHGVPTTTNALILPSMPSQSALAQPLPDGGEIIVTGSIDLPRSYGATGLHPSQLDTGDVDRLIDHVEDAGGAGAAPVSASRAVSTQGHPRDMIAPPKKEGVNAPLVLAVTAGVLALGVVASLIVGAMVGIF